MASSILGVSRTLKYKLLFMSDAPWVARFDNRSARAFSFLGIYSNCSDAKVRSRSFTFCRYLGMLSSHGSYPPYTCLMTSRESLWTFKSLVILSPITRASYSASLFEDLNLKHKAYSAINPSRLVRTSLALDPALFKDPSTWRIQDYSLTSSTLSSTLGLARLSPSSFMVHSITKSASTWTFIDGRERYLMSNSPNSMAHLTT